MGSCPTCRRCGLLRSSICGNRDSHGRPFSVSQGLSEPGRGHVLCMATIYRGGIYCVRRRACSYPGGSFLGIDCAHPPEDRRVRCVWVRCGGRSADGDDPEGADATHAVDARCSAHRWSFDDLVDTEIAASDLSHVISDGLLVQLRAGIRGAKRREPRNTIPTYPQALRTLMPARPLTGRSRSRTRKAGPRTQSSCGLSETRQSGGSGPGRGPPAEGRSAAECLAMRAG